MKKTFIGLFAVFAILVSCGGGMSEDMNKAKNELDALLSKTIKVQSDAIKVISQSTNADEIVAQINAVIGAKMQINPGIDAIASKYPNLKPEEVEKIKEFVGEKMLDMALAEGEFYQAVDQAVRLFIDDQSKSQPIIEALGVYQNLGQ